MAARFGRESWWTAGLTRSGLSRMVSENKHTRRPDVVLFINGLPLVLIELKNAAERESSGHVVQRSEE